MKTTVVIPAYNEERAIGITIKEVRKALPDSEIIVVDDGSIDRTYQIAEKVGKKYNSVKVIRHERNRGKAIALRTGYKRASGDIILTIDSDYTYPGYKFPRLIKKLEQGYDLVVGSRFKNYSIPKGFPLYKSMFNIMGSIFASFLALKKITDITSGMRVFKKELIELPIKARGLDYEVEFTLRSITNGYKYGEIELESIRKRIGRSKLNFFTDCLRFLFAIFRGRL